MNFKLILFVAMIALLGMSAFASADEEQKRQSVVKSCEAKNRTDCKACCGKQGLQAQMRGRCVCSRYFN